MAYSVLVQDFCFWISLACLVSKGCFMSQTRVTFATEDQDRIATVLMDRFSSVVIFFKTDVTHDL